MRNTDIEMFLALFVLNLVVYGIGWYAGAHYTEKQIECVQVGTNAQE